MEEWLVNKLGHWVIVILLCGSIADFIQFTWIMKRSIQRWRRRIYLKIKHDMEASYAREILREQRSKRKDGKTDLERIHERLSGEGS